MNNRLHKIWYDMVRRCTNPKCQAFNRYGERGIKVSEEWLDDKNFIRWAKISGYSPHLTLERIDVNGNYCAQNCKWATYKEQGINKRNNRVVTYQGKTQTISEWSKETGISFQTLKYRLDAKMDINSVFITIDRRKLKRRIA